MANESQRHSRIEEAKLDQKPQTELDQKPQTELDQKPQIELDQKPQTEHVESLSSSSSNITPEQGEEGMTKAKWLACIALGLGYTTFYQQNACTATILKHIDEELGPTTYYNWMLTSYTIATAVSLPLAGGLSDIFGRKGFFIAGCGISLIGTIVALSAQSVTTVIVGMTLKGIGAGGQQLALAAVAEIVPNKHRGYAQAGMDILALPWTVFGALTGNAMVKYQALSFRINWIIGTLLNALTILTAWLWYHPPGPRKVEGKSKLTRVLELDWIGIALMAFGIVLLLVGITFGGSLYPWRHAGVIAPIVIGCFLLILLGLWEWKGARNPFFAHELFAGKTRTFTLILIITFVAGMSLYAAAAFWTQQVQGMFSTDPIKIGIWTIPGGFGGACGGFLAGMVMGKHWLLKSNYCLIYGLCMKIIGDGVFTTITPYDLPLALGMGFFSMFGVGFVLVSVIVCAQLACEDSNLGLATLVLGSARSIGGSVAITIYSSVMTNTLAKDAGPRVGKAVIPLGLPRTSLPALVKNLMGGKVEEAMKLPGMNEKILRAAAEALRWSWGLSFKWIYTTAAAFSALGLVAAVFVSDVTHNMNDNVAVRLKNEGPKKDKNEV